jgi:hypothetical protein
MAVTLTSTHSCLQTPIHELEQQLPQLSIDREDGAEATNDGYRSHRGDGSTSKGKGQEKRYWMLT